jgi:hypothetical protein
MPGRPGPRFALEALFLIALAVGAGLADLESKWIAAVMAGGWLIVALLELTADRIWAAAPPWRRPYYAPAPPARAEPVSEPPASPAPEERPQPAAEPERIPVPAPDAATVIAPGVEAVPATPAGAAAPAARLEPAAQLEPAVPPPAEPEPEPVAGEPEPEPEREPTVAQREPGPEPEPEQPAQDFEREPEPEPQPEPGAEEPPRPKLEPVEARQRRSWFRRRERREPEVIHEPELPKHVRLLPSTPEPSGVPEEVSELVDAQEPHERR